jgi:Fe-S metabolism associated sufE
MSIEEKQNEIIEELHAFDDMMDRYAAVIDYGQSLGAFDPKAKTPANKIEGCQGDVWLDAKLVDGKVYYSAETNVLIIKGLIAIILDILNGHTPDEIANANLSFVSEILGGNYLTPNRVNGLLAVVKQIKVFALAFKALEDKEK